MKALTTLTFALLVSICVSAQGYRVSGIIVDKAGNPMKGAGVQLFSPGSNTPAKAATTKGNGSFSLSGISTGDYILKVTYVGFREMEMNITVRGSLILGRLTLEETSTLLNDVEIREEAPTAVVKGDTTEINASAYKANPDATSEELVAKIPGVTVEEGKVKAQGEEVKKVLIDGKNFFGDDPSAVLRNMPAEVIDKVQIFDKKSDQAEFTGFDDGSTTKTMNIITKAMFRDGTFGRFSAGAGWDDAWKGSAILNRFQGDRRITFLGQANNVSEQNFSSEDLVGSLGMSGGMQSRITRMMGGGGGGFGGMMPGMGGDFGGLFNALSTGIITTKLLGVNYMDEWKKIEITGSYFLNLTDNNAFSATDRQYITGSNEGMEYNENNKSSSQNINHRMNIRMEYKIDSMNSILFQPRFSIQHNNNINLLDGANTLESLLISQTHNDNDVKLEGWSVSAPVMYRHSFIKKGRTISLNVNPTWNDNSGNSYLYSYSFYADSIYDTVDQYAWIGTSGVQVRSTLTYTEPLWKNNQLQLTYGNTFSDNTANKQTYDWSPLSGEYSEPDTSLSNKSNSDYAAHSGGLALRRKAGNWNFTAGINWQSASLGYTQHSSPYYRLEKDFTSFLPNAMIQFRPSKQLNLRINLRSSNNIPSTEKLQYVLNNSNPLQLSIGNPDLKQDRQYSLNARFSRSSANSNNNFFLMLNASLTDDLIGNSTYLALQDDTIFGVPMAGGSQLSWPVNLNGYYNIRLFANFSFPVKFISCKLNLNVSSSYTHTPSLINGKENLADRYSNGAGIVISSNISEKVDFTLSNNANWNNQENTLKTGSDSRYFSNTAKMRITIMPWKGLVLQTDITNQSYDGLTASYEDNYTLWNAALGYKFLKKRQAELRIGVTDILEENKSLSRNLTDLYYEDVRTNLLQRYYMVTFSYNIRSFSKNQTNTPFPFHRPERFMEPPPPGG